MPQKVSSFSEIKYGWNFGESNWNEGADENWIKGGFWIESLIDGVVSSLPSGVNGQAFYLTTDNRVYVYTDNLWKSFPVPRWATLKLRATGEVYQFDGTVFSKIQSPSEISEDLVAIQSSIDALGTASLEDVSYFATADQLDVVEAQLSGEISGFQSDIMSSSDLSKGANLVGRSVVHFSDIEQLVSTPSSARSSTHAYLVDSYYQGEGKGGGQFVWLEGSSEPADDVIYFTPSVEPTGMWKRLHNGEVSLWDAGCKTDIGFDNQSRILNALYSEASIVKVPSGQFQTSSLKLSVSASDKSLVGFGSDSCLSLIGNMTAQTALLHLPKVGDAYGGTYAGPSNFCIDMLRLRGDEATGTVSTTGLLIYDGNNTQVGTLWSHGFYKSGFLVAGNPTRINVLRYYGYNNGNQVGASTGGQGMAVSHDTVDYPALHVEYAECWDNGINNFGQGLDLVKGNSTFGTLVFHDNGASGMKVVTPNKVKIGTLICLRNNLHAGQTFGAFYTNGDFGEIQIGRFEVESPAGSGLVVVNSGRLKIGTFVAKNCPSSGITTPVPAGKDATIHIDNIEVDTVTATAVSLAAPGVLDFHSDNIVLRNTTAGGVTANVRNLYIGELITKECGAVSLTIQGTPESAFVQKVRAHSSTYTGSAVAVASGVVNAAIISARRGGSYTNTLSDSGTTTYKPNIV